MSESWRVAMARPWLGGNEQRYVREALAAEQVSGGSFVRRFEEAFAAWLGVRWALATSSGTTALHLALLAAGVGPGDEVIVPDVTFVATANAVRYCGATPVLVDICPDTWTLDVAQAQTALTARTRAILAVHLYGAPAAMTTLRALAHARGLALIEDVAEALGSEVAGQKAGSLGDVGCFSFYGNKTITTGEGGMVATNWEDVAQRVLLLRGQAVAPGRAYWHTEMGYNYRMGELQGAVGLAQIERIDAHLAARRQVRAWYEERLAGNDQGWALQARPSGTDPVFWMNAARNERQGGAAAQAARRLAQANVETRPVFTPMHALPMYEAPGRAFRQSMRLWQHGVVLPTHAQMNAADVALVTAALLGEEGR